MFWNRKKREQKTPQQITWRTPEGMDYVPLYEDLLSQEHILIAGTAGAGKSVLLNAILTTAITNHSPASLKMYLIDFKRTELSCFKRLPHVLGYINDTAEAFCFLNNVLAEINRRYEVMEAQGLRKWNGAYTLIVIDELLPLVVHNKKALTVLSEIAFIGRAAGYKVLACTQDPSRRTIPALLSKNFSCRIGLRCNSAIDSRQAIEATGCEKLPEYGYFYLRTRKPGIQLYKFNPVTEEAIQARVNYWNSPECRVA